MKLKKIKVYEGMKKNRKLTLKKILLKIEITIIAIYTITSLIVPKFVYIPVNRKENKTNIYEGNQIIISSDEQKSIIKELEKKLNIDIPDNDFDNYFLLKAIYDNDNLSSKEKVVLYHFIDYFNDNPYLDNEEVYNKLLNVDTHFSLLKFLGTDETTLACYIEEYNDIVYFTWNPEIATIAHEGGHCISGQCLPRWFEEGMTQLIVNEYFYEDPFNGNRTYYNEVVLVKFLCELIGIDNMLRAYSEGNVDLIYEKLGKLYGTSEEAKRSLSIVDNYCKNILSVPTYEEFENRTNALTEENLNDIIDGYGYLTKCADAISYSDYDNYDTEAIIYLYKELTYSLLGDKDNCVLCKAYISSKLKQDYGMGVLVDDKSYPQYSLD